MVAREMIEVSAEEKQLIELVRQSDYTKAAEVIEMLRLAEAVIKDMEQDAPDEEEVGVNWREDTRQAFIDVALGNTLTEEEFWKALDDDEET